MVGQTINDPPRRKKALTRKLGASVQQSVGDIEKVFEK